MVHKTLCRASKKAFTLVELVVVILVLSVLATVAAIGYSAAISRTGTEAARTEAFAFDRTYRARLSFYVVDGVDAAAMSQSVEDSKIELINTGATEFAYTQNDVADLTDDQITYVSHSGASVTIIPTSEFGKSSSITVDGSTVEAGSFGTELPQPVTLSYPATNFSLSNPGQAFTPTAGGGLESFSFSYTGTLPDGLTFDPATGAILAPAVWNGDIVEISTHEGASCAITAIGGVQCWGTNNYGQLGDGTTSNAIEGSFVVPTGLETGVIKVEVNSGSACSLDNAGTVKCWGRNDYGQIGNGTSGSDVLTPTIITLPSGNPAVDIAVGNDFALAVDSLGGVYGWGRQDYGALGDGEGRDQWGMISSSPKQAACANGNNFGCSMTQNSAVTQVRAGDNFACGYNGSQIKCWGRSHLGQTYYSSQATTVTSWTEGNCGKYSWTSDVICTTPYLSSTYLSGVNVLEEWEISDNAVCTRYGAYNYWHVAGYVPVASGKIICWGEKSAYGHHFASGWAQYQQESVGYSYSYVNTTTSGDYWEGKTDLTAEQRATDMWFGEAGLCYRAESNSIYCMGPGKNGIYGSSPINASPDTYYTRSEAYPHPSVAGLHTLDTAFVDGNIADIFIGDGGTAFFITEHGVFASGFVASNASGISSTQPDFTVSNGSTAQVLFSGNTGYPTVIDITVSDGEQTATQTIVITLN